MKKARHIIGLVFLILGMLFCLGSAGRLDFLAENATIEACDERCAVIKAVFGIALMGAGMCLNYDLEFEDK